MGKKAMLGRILEKLGRMLTKKKGRGRRRR
jgi:hypothetical protein